MGNTIQIKRGSGQPGAGILADGELGYDTENNRLYIGVEEGTSIDAAKTKLDIYETGREIGKEGTQYSNLDLNTYTTPGLYVCTSRNAANSTNSPIKNNAFKLVVIKGYNNNHLKQLIFAGDDNRVYIRSAARTSPTAAWTWIDWTLLSLPSLEDLGVTASTTELNKLKGLTASTTELNKLKGLTASTTELNKLKGLIASTTELNYLDGATSNIQDQLNTKQVNILDIGTEIPQGSNLDNYKTPGKYYFPSSETNLTNAQKITNSPFTTSGYGIIVMSGYIKARVWQIAFGVNKIRHRYYNGSDWDEWKTITSS